MKRTYCTLNDCEMQHNAEVGLFTKPSFHEFQWQHTSVATGGQTANMRTCPQIVKNHRQNLDILCGLWHFIRGSDGFVKGLV